MFKFLVKLAFVIMGFYLLAQIPFFRGYAENIKTAFYEKIANVSNEITRITEKAESAKAKVDETKKTVDNITGKVKETAGAVENTLGVVGNAVNEVNKALSDEESEAGTNAYAGGGAGKVE